MQIGLDIGSTTIKIAVMDDAGNLLFSKYQRHYSQIAEKLLELHKELLSKYPTLRRARLAISGSAGLGLSELCGLQFVQEVFAEKVCTERLHPATNAVIELGGEDAKILFLGRHFDARMNDSCLRRYRCLYRPDGQPFKRQHRGYEQSGRSCRQHLYYCQPLRRFCQKRYPAPFEPGRCQGGFGQ